MGNHNNSIAERMNFLEFFHDNVTATTVEIAGWLIGKNNAGVGDEATRNGDALLLAARKLVGHVIFAFAQMEMFKNSVGHFKATSFAIAGINEWQGNIFNYAEIGNEIETLENKTNFFGAEMRLFTGGDTLNVFASEAIFARSSFIE